MACVTGSRLDFGDGTVACSCVAGSRVISGDDTSICSDSGTAKSRNISGDEESSCSSSGVADSRFCSSTCSGGFVTQMMVTPFFPFMFPVVSACFSLEVELQQYLQAPPRCNHSSHRILFVSSSVHLCFQFPEQWQVRLLCLISLLPWNLS